MKKFFFFFLAFVSIQAGEIDHSGAASLILIGSPSFIFLSPITLASGGIVAPSVISEKLSAENGKNAIIKNRYQYFEKLMAQKKFREIKAGDIFNQQEMYLLSLNKDDDMFFDKTSMGILVSNSNDILFLVPSEIKYSDVLSKETR
jgi:hypothetical protein